MTNVVFRTDASFAIGTGHVMRCLALAAALRSKGVAITFVCREHDGNLCNLIADSAFDVATLPAMQPLPRDEKSKWIGATWEDDAAQTRDAIERRGIAPDWLIADHYALDERWERGLRSSVKRILVIDDLADRPHDCDVILDQNFYEEPSARYAGLVPAHCIYALGPQFALLRAEFFEARSHLVSRDGRLRTILVAMGGADKTNETGKVLEALCAASFTQFRIDVLLGTLNRHKEELLVRYAEMPHVHFHASDSNVAVLMASADLSIGGGGTMNWERCFMGLPSVIIVVAQNQLETNEALHRAGCVVNLGWHADVSASRIAAVVSQLADDPIAVQTLSRRSLALMSPSGSNESDLKILQLLIGAVNDRR